MSVKAMSAVWEANLKPGAKLVLLAIADHADGNGVCWPGQEFIAEKCCMNRSTVNQHIADLEKDGYLVIEKRRSDCGRQAPSIYKLVFERLNANPALENPTLKRSKNSQSRVGNSNAARVWKLDTGNANPALENPALENPALENPALEKQPSRVGNSNSYTFNEPSRTINSFCADPSGSPQAVIKIPLNVSGTFHEIFSDDVEKYSQLYPAVDVMQQLRNMVGWSDANPTKRKTKDGIKRFINSWLAKDQDRGGSKLPLAAVNQQIKPVPQYIPPEQRNLGGNIIDSTAKRL